MIGNRYELKENEEELLLIEKDLSEYLDVSFVKCSYDSANSHKHKNTHEVNYRKEQAKEIGIWNICDYIINYEIYDTEEEYRKNAGGVDGEVHELLYLKGNGDYIVITDCEE
jgi:hypothetical protein